MDENISMMPGQEYAKKIENIIEPLIAFEKLCDKSEKQSKLYKNRISGVEGKYVPLYIFPPFGFMILYIILNLRPLLYYSLPRIFMLIVFGLSAYFFYRYAKPKIKEETEKLKHQEKIENERMQLEMNKLAESFYSDLVKYVPEKYQYSQALQLIYDYLKMGRAQNLMGAMNLYEEEMHRMRMEDMQAEIVKHNKYQTALQAVSAIANVSAAFSAASAASSLDSIDHKL